MDKNTLSTTYTHQARISALELLVIELLATQPNARSIIESFTAKAAEQQAIQASIGTEPALRDAFRAQIDSLLHDVQLRLP